MIKAKKYVYTKHFVGMPKLGDLQIIEEELPPIKDEQFLAEAVYLGVDPYMRACAPGLSLGQTCIGDQLALVKESKNTKFPVGKYVVGQLGWRTHTISEGTANGIPVIVLPDLGDLPLSLGIGMLGMPGNAAYFGFLEICKPKAGETVVISGAAGSIGNHVGQIAKIKGCKVIGIAGSDEKGKWLLNELKFDHFINYKTENIAEALKKAAPQGVDCYFDNVGGKTSSIVLKQMNQFGRISICGGISTYNDPTQKVPLEQLTLILQQLRMEGFLAYRWVDRWSEGIEQNLKWLKEGKLKYRETVTEGFENMSNAFIDMLNGLNTGKAVVKV